MGEKRLGSRVPLSTRLAVMLLPLRMLMVNRVKFLWERKMGTCPWWPRTPTESQSLSSQYCAIKSLKTGWFWNHQMPRYHPRHWVDLDLCIGLVWWMICHWCFILQRWSEEQGRKTGGGEQRGERTLGPLHGPCSFLFKDIPYIYCLKFPRVKWTRTFAFTWQLIRSTKMLKYGRGA